MQNDSIVVFSEVKENEPRFPKELIHLCLVPMHVSQRPNLTKPQNTVMGEVLRQENPKDASREKWSEDVQNTVLRYF